MDTSPASAAQKPNVQPDDLEISQKTLDSAERCHCWCVPKWGSNMFQLDAANEINMGRSFSVTKTPPQPHQCLLDHWLDLIPLLEVVSLEAWQPGFKSIGSRFHQDHQVPRVTLSKRHTNLVDEKTQHLTDPEMHGQADEPVTIRKNLNEKRLKTTEFRRPTPMARGPHRVLIFQTQHRSQALIHLPKLSSREGTSRSFTNNDADQHDQPYCHTCIKATKSAVSLPKMLLYSQKVWGWRYHSDSGWYNQGIMGVGTLPRKTLFGSHHQSPLRWLGACCCTTCFACSPIYNFRNCSKKYKYLAAKAAKRSPCQPGPGSLETLSG